MERIFIGFYPTKEILGKVEQIKIDNEDLINGRWVESQQIHLTLQFIGGVKKEDLDLISKNLEKVASDFKSFEVIYKSVGFFPNVKRPKIMWVGIEDMDCYVASIVSLLNDLNKKFVKEEKKKFTPHLTLARIDYIRSRDAKMLVDKYQTLVLGTQKITQIHLIKSQLKKEGAHYSILKSFEL